jgi:hypothetical protein
MILKNDYLQTSDFIYFHNGRWIFLYECFSPLNSLIPACVKAYSITKFQAAGPRFSHSIMISSTKLKAIPH